MVDMIISEKHVMNPHSSQDWSLCVRTAGGAVRVRLIRAAAGQDIVVVQARERYNN